VSRTVLLVTHSEWREARIAPMLQAKGYAVERRCPARGCSMPEDVDAYAGAIVLGGAQSANDGPTTPYIAREIDWIGDYVAGGGRYLGICLGGQLLARAFGARVDRHPDGANEIGYYPLRPTALGRAFFPEELYVYHWHQEGFELPHGAELLATGEAFPNQAFRLGHRAYGLQFHPEVRPADARAWMEDVCDSLQRPGAQSREQQESGFARHDPPLEAWLDGFLDHWLATDTARPTASAARAVAHEVITTAEP
jgi:GMP synthase (glutamine-hydrolysing)